MKHIEKLDIYHYNKCRWKKRLNVEGENKMTEEKLEEMHVGEALVKEAKENRTREILAIIEKCENLEEAKGKIKALL